MIDTLHMILPGLFHSIGKLENENECYPSLFRLLTKATVVPDRPESFEGVLKQYFTGLSTREIPAGSLSALAHGVAELDDGRTWMRADPVYLKADAKALYCYGNQHLHIEKHEFQSVVQSLNEHFKHDGIELIAVTPNKWLVACNGPQQMATNALADVEGRSIDQMLPSGPDAMHWHKRLNEAQLLLNQHPVNVARQKRGMLPINSLWFWGLGRLPVNLKTYFDCVYSESKHMKGLCRIADTPCFNGLNHFNEYYNLIEQHAYQSCAIIDSRIKRANNLTDIALREKLLSYYEKNWFEPMANALLEGRIKSIYLDACQGRRFVISKRHFKYFWRKNPNIMSYES